MERRRLSLTSRPSGFTLYELLVVIGLGALFSTYIVVRFTNQAHRQRAKDLVRAADVNFLVEAIEEYYSDYNRLPGVVGQIYQSNLTIDGYLCGNCANIEVGWLDGDDFSPYLEKYPVDPDNSPPAVYRYRHDGTSYLVDCWFEFPGNSGQAQGDGGLDPGRYELGTGVGTISF